MTTMIVMMVMVIYPLGYGAQKGNQHRSSCHGQNHMEALSLLASFEGSFVEVLQFVIPQIILSVKTFCTF